MERKSFILYNHINCYENSNYKEFIQKTNICKREIKNTSCMKSNFKIEKKHFLKVTHNRKYTWKSGFSYLHVNVIQEKEKLINLILWHKCMQIVKKLVSIQCHSTRNEHLYVYFQKYSYHAFICIYYNNVFYKNVFYIKLFFL